MKAQSFLREIIDTSNRSIAPLNPMPFVDGLSKFLSQPFDPAKVTELFEGWESRGLNAPQPDAIQFESTSASIGISINQKVFMGSDVGHFRFELAKTLNDFIRDCERSGIELEWNTKNKEVKEVFGL